MWSYYKLIILLMVFSQLRKSLEVIADPTPQPSIQPSSQPTSYPSAQPSMIPTGYPTTIPSSQPSSRPSSQPSLKPSGQPSGSPSTIPTVQPSSNPSSIPTAQPSIVPSSQPSQQPSSLPSSQPSDSPTTIPTVKPTLMPSSQPTRQPSAAPSAQPSSSPTNCPTTSPTTQPSGSPTSRPSAQPTILPTSCPSSQPSEQPSSQPSTYPSVQPSTQPSIRPSAQPTEQPSTTPSSAPSSQPSVQPTTQPAGAPTSRPSTQPTMQPSSSPTTLPSAIPTGQPSMRPTVAPSTQPSVSPSMQPTRTPTSQPSGRPTKAPSAQPTAFPSAIPSNTPSSQPSGSPSALPSALPSTQPTVTPSSMPSAQPSTQPSAQPFGQPSAQPTSSPSSLPTAQPSIRPSAQPSTIPSASPSAQPSSDPSGLPSTQPSTQPSSCPSVSPTSQPSSRPSGRPSTSPSSQPSSVPSAIPTSLPSSRPSRQPTGQPTGQPQSRPTSQPTVQPSSRPSALPSAQPSIVPSVTPSAQPSARPSSMPTARPSMQPTKQPSCQPTLMPTAQPSGIPSSTPSVLPSSQPSQQPSSRPSTQPSARPSKRPTAQPSLKPSTQPSAQPTSRPSTQPSSQPSSLPSMQPSVQPTIQPSSQPTGVPSSQPSIRPSTQPSAQPSSTPSAQPSSQPSSQPSMQPSVQPTIQPSSQPTGVPSSQPSIQPSTQPSAQPSSTPSAQPSSQPSSQPSTQPTAQPSAQPTSYPTGQPTAQPTVQPSRQPTSQPSAQPTTQPSGEPTAQPSAQPSLQPSSQPSMQPSVQPSSQPTVQPSNQPTSQPSTQPTVQPTSQPSGEPTSQPSTQPSALPTTQPSAQPTGQPSMQPSSQPSFQPSVQPSSQPSTQPTSQPSVQPSLQPTSVPTMQPSSQPSGEPTGQPTGVPTGQPSAQPSALPSAQPSQQPSSLPTTQPTSVPSAQPSGQPSSQPTMQPSALPSTQPTTQPSRQPTVQPSAQPSQQPSCQPTVQPSAQPTSAPSTQPSSQPSARPSTQPSVQPSVQPSAQPSGQPTGQPSLQPSGQPTTQPTAQPSRQPTRLPTAQPTLQPSGQPSSTPSGQPTGQPSSRPTTAKQISVGFTVQQVVARSTKARFLADPNAALVFRMTIAQFVPGLTKDNIIIYNVTDFFEPTFSARQGSPGAIPLTSAVVNTAGKLPSHTDKLHPEAEITGINVDYRVEFVAQRVVVTSSDPQVAFTQASTLIDSAIKTGKFNTAVKALAAVNNQNSPALAEAVSGPYQFGIATSYSAEIVRSAMPTSQPSGQPSRQPTVQPSRQPSSQPTRSPSGQPSASPTGQPSSHPTLTVETRWSGVVAQLFTTSTMPDVSDRVSYFATEVSGSNLYGSCESWNHYLRFTLPATRDAKVIDSLRFVAQYGELGATAHTTTCSDAAISNELIDLLARPLIGHQPQHRINASVVCDNHRWVVRDCFPGDADAVYSVQASSTGGTVSRAVCIDCVNPCADYDCQTSSGNWVLSPCTREESCPYLDGSVQVFSAYYSDSGGTGVSAVFIWFGAAWGLIALSVLLYNHLILTDRDWKLMRSTPRLSFRQSSLQSIKVSNFKAIVPEPPLSPGNRPPTALKTAPSTTDQVRNLAAMVHGILDRLVIAAGQNRAMFASTELVPIMQKLWHRMVTKNHYFAMYTAATQRERFLHALNITVRVSWLFFCVALCLWFNYPDDDNSCYSKTSEDDCRDRVTLFDSNQEYCEWVGLTGPDSSYYDGGQSLHQAQCVWRVPTGSMVTVLHIVLVTIVVLAIPRIFYSSFLLESVLLAPGGQRKVFAHHRTQRTGASSATTSVSRKVGVTTDGQSALHRDVEAAYLDTKDSRFFSLTLGDSSTLDDGGYLESGDAGEDPSLLFRAFLFEFTKYRSMMLTAIDDTSEEFEREWASANTFIWNFTGTLKELNEDFELPVTCAQQMFPSDQAQLALELSNVYRTADTLSPSFKDYLLQGDEDQFSVRLMAAFSADLLGKDSIQGRLFHSLLGDLLQDSALFRDVRNWVKFCAILFLLGTCLCLVYGCIAVLQGFSARRQWYWIVTAAVAVGVDMVLVEGLETLWFHWALPLCICDSLTALRHTLISVLDRFQRTAAPMPPSTPGYSRSLTTRAASASHPGYCGSRAVGTGAYKDFSMPNYQFVSTNVAHRFPRQLASRIVLSYESVYPRTITGQRWPNTATTAQLLCAGRSWSSGLGFESIGYVLFSYAVMWIGIYCPAWLQRIGLAGLLSLAIWLVSWLVFSILDGRLVGVYIAAGVVGTCLLVLFSYRFSWDHDSEHYSAGIEALHIPTAAHSTNSPSGLVTQRDLHGLKDHDFHKDPFNLEPVDHFPLQPSSPVAREGLSTGVWSEQSSPMGHKQESSSPALSIRLSSETSLSPPQSPITGPPPALPQPSTPIQSTRVPSLVRAESAKYAAYDPARLTTNQTSPSLPRSPVYTLDSTALNGDRPLSTSAVRVGRKHLSTPVTAAAATTERDDYYLTSSSDDETKS